MYTLTTRSEDKLSRSCDAKLFTRLSTVPPRQHPSASHLPHGARYGKMAAGEGMLICDLTPVAGLPQWVSEPGVADASDNKYPGQSPTMPVHLADISLSSCKMSAKVRCGQRLVDSAGTDASRCRPLGLVILRRQFVIYVPDERYPHLCRVIAAQDVADKVCLDLHLNHLQGATKDPTVDVGEPQLVLRPPVVRQLDEVRQGVLVKDKRELLAVVRPVGDLGGDVQEYLEPDLAQSVSGWFRQPDVVSFTRAIISAVSLKLAQRFMVLDLAR